MNRLVASFTTVLTVTAVLIITLLLLKLVGPLPLTITQTTTSKATTFDAIGEGSVQVIPDRASATFGITNSAQSVADAQSRVNQTINKLKTDLKSIGIEEKDIKTTSYSVSPDYSYDGSKPRITGYNVTSQIQVNFRDFSKLNQAFDTATQDGVNLAGQVSFGLSDEAQQKADDQARKMAIDQAKAKAERTARDAGIKLGKILNVTEQVNNPRYATLLPLATGTEKQTDIAPGTSEVKISVTVSYETL